MRELDPHRFFDPNEKVRNIAYELYATVKDLPIVSPHGHVDAGMLANNKPFPDPTELIIIPDHYIYRLLYSQGVALESLGETHDRHPGANVGCRGLQHLPEVLRRYAHHHDIGLGGHLLDVRGGAEAVGKLEAFEVDRVAVLVVDLLCERCLPSPDRRGGVLGRQRGDRRAPASSADHANPNRHNLTVDSPEWALRSSSR